VDLWAVRRRPVAPPRSTDWPLAVGERTLIEGEARFAQFQAHLSDLLATMPVPANLRARDHFRWLPAAGVLPVAGPDPRGVSATTFFGDMKVRFPRLPRFAGNAGPVFMDGARLPPLLRDATRYPPVDTREGEALWLYRVRENRLARDLAAAGAGTAVIVFASGEMPYYGSPRFDVSRWDYANYSSTQTGPAGI
jgi:hypothetical protein